MCFIGRCSVLQCSLYFIFCGLVVSCGVGAAYILLLLLLVDIFVLFFGKG
jgi:hypothetical protein